LGSVVKMSHKGSACKYLGWTPDRSEAIKLTHDGFGVFVAPSLEVQSCKQGGAMLESPLIPAGATVLLRTKHTMCAAHYTALISLCPELTSEGACSCPTLLNTGDGSEFEVRFTPSRAFDVAKLEWLVKIVFLD